MFKQTKTPKNKELLSLSLIPDDSYRLILQFLDTNTLLSLDRVCKNYNQINQHIWKSKPDTVHSKFYTEVFPRFFKRIKNSARHQVESIYHRLAKELESIEQYEREMSSRNVGYPDEYCASVTKQKMDALKRYIAKIISTHNLEDLSTSLQSMSEDKAITRHRREREIGYPTNLDFLYEFINSFVKSNSANTIDILKNDVKECTDRWKVLENSKCGLK